MLPSFPRRQLVLPSRAAPPFLAHQRECNNLAISFVAAGATLWASSWDRPFPPLVGGVAMPQPDLVLVVRASSCAPRLIFVEHDRGQESKAHFERAKLDRYVGLHRMPQFCEDTLGFRAFDVAVTVNDVAGRRPLARLRTLSTFARARGASALFSFTLAGWAHTQPLGAVWFRHGTLPTSAALRPNAHASLVTLLGELAGVSSCQGPAAPDASESSRRRDDTPSEHPLPHMPGP